MESVQLDCYTVLAFWLLTVGLSVGYGTQTPIGRCSYFSYWLVSMHIRGVSNCRWLLVSCNALWNHVTLSFFKGHWESPGDSPMHSPNAGHRDCQIVYAPVNSPPPCAIYMHQWTVSASVQIMACLLVGAEPLSEPMLDHYQLDPWEQ